MDILLDDDAVFINGIVKAEILTGTRTLEGYNRLHAVLEGLVFLETEKDFWDKVSYNGYILRRNAITVPLTDLVIATHCLENNLELFHNDKHFRLIATCLALKETS